MVTEILNLDEENERIVKRYKENLKRALEARSLKIKHNELTEQQKFARSLPIADKNSLFWLGIGLYWAEGAKTERWRAVFYNSDPTINKVMMRFFREICGIANVDIRIQMILHKSINEQEAKKFWSKELSVPVRNFFKASYSLSTASKHKRPIRRLPFGTIQISVRGKAIANKMKGWLLGVKEKF